MGGKHPAVRQSKHNVIKEDRYQMLVMMTVAVSATGSVWEIADGRRRPVSTSVRDDVLERVQANKEKVEKDKEQSRALAAQAAVQREMREAQEANALKAKKHPPYPPEVSLWFNDPDAAVMEYARRLGIDPATADAELHEAGSQAEATRLQRPVNRLRAWLASRVGPKSRLLPTA